MGFLSTFTSLRVEPMDQKFLSTAKKLQKEGKPGSFQAYSKVKSNPIRHYYMGESCLNGIDTPASTTKAYRAYSLAALEGNFRAQLRIWEGVKFMQKLRWLLPPLIGSYFAETFYGGVILNEMVVIMISLMSGASWIMQRRQDPAVAGHWLSKFPGLLLWFITVAVIQCAGAALIGYPSFWLIQKRIPEEAMKAFGFYPLLACSLFGAHALLMYLLPRL